MHDLPPIRKRIVCIGGNLQARFGQTGIARIYLQLRQRFESQDCCTSLHPWNENWKRLVEHFIATGPQAPEELDVCIVGYSWGIGHGAVKLARRLLGEGVHVRRLVSCDGVYRNPWMLWRSLASPVLGTPTIEIPANVKRVDFVRQKTNIPMGHPIAAVIPAATKLIDHGFLFGWRHQDADNSKEFLRLALEAAA